MPPTIKRGAAIIFAICAVPRLLALLIFPHPPPTAFGELASSLLSTGRFGYDGNATTYLEPLYPLFLAGARLITAGSPTLVLLLQIATGSLGGVLLYSLGSRLANPRVGFVAATLYAVYPYLVRQSVALLAITLWTTLAIAATLALSRTERWRHAMGTGVVFGLLLLTRVSLAPSVVAAAVWLACVGRGRLAIVMVVTCLLTVGPWMIRNMYVDGSPLPSRLGENLYLSTSRYAATIVPIHDIDLLLPLAQADVRGSMVDRQLPFALEQRAMDDAMLARAVAFIREHPAQVLWLKARNTLYLLSPLLLPRDAKSAAAIAKEQDGMIRLFNVQRRPWREDLAHTFAQSVILLLAGVGLIRRGLVGRDAPMLILFVTEAALCVVFFPSTRLIAPVMFVPMIYAAVGLDSVCGPQILWALAPVLSQSDEGPVVPAHQL